MFCSKCGLQNADQTKFCRGCGADLRSLAAAGDVQTLSARAISEKHIDLFSSGMRGLITGIGFLIVAGAAFGISARLAFMGLFFLAFASYFVGTGISRLIHARGLKALDKRDEAAALAPGHPDYIRPSMPSIYDTEDLMARPLSVTEHTTTHLQIDQRSPDE